MNELRIEIPLTSMKRGRRNSGKYCPIAITIKNKFDSPIDVRRTYLMLHGRRYRFTSSLSRWIKRFDDGLIVPFIDIVFGKGRVGIRSNKERRFNSRFNYETNESL